MTDVPRAFARGSARVRGQRVRKLGMAFIEISSAYLSPYSKRRRIRQRSVDWF